MFPARPLRLSVALGVSLLALSAKAALAQMTPDFPIGGNRAAPPPPDPEMVTTGTVARVGPAQVVGRFRSGLALYAWRYPALRRAVSEALMASPLWRRNGGSDLR